MKDADNQLALSKEQIDSVIVLYSNGQYQEAINQIKTLNEAYPNVPLLFNLIGACYKELGQLEGAVKMFETAVSIKPDYIEALKNLGITLRDLGQLEASVKSLKEAIIIGPNYVDAHYNLAITFKQLDNLKDAIDCYEKVLAINPNFADAHNNLGNIFKGLGKNKAAVESYKKAIVIKPNFAEAHSNLGNVFKNLGHLDDAVKSFEKAIEINPNFSEAHNNLGITLGELGKLHAAINCYEKVIAINPDYFEAHKNLGFILLKLGKSKAAANFFERALVINPDYAEAHKNLGYAFKKNKKIAKALLSFTRAQEINPDMNFILGDILNSKMQLCLWDNLSGLINELTEKINNNGKVIAPFPLLSLTDNPRLLRKNTEVFSKEIHPKNNVLSKINRYPRHQKIRIGYFSADFRIHPITTLTAELYEMHDRNNFEIHAFSFGPDTNDEMKLRIKAGVDHFHDVDSKSHNEIALLARSLEIDIAVDLGGHTANSRTEIFAMSAAPIQLSYIGYLGTMGADYYDYLIADPIMIPKENQKHYVEKIVYLPSFQVNDSSQSPPEVTLTRKDLGLPKKGFVFCCFNNTYKFTPTTFDSWARILHAVEDSVLIIYANNELSKTNLSKEIVLRGVESERLIFGDSLAKPQYLARYRVADLFLDTNPYNAGTTASDALRMGLPMLTLKGESYQARMGASILNAMNLPELVTTTSKEYEALAIELAKNPEKLKAIKDKLVSNLSTAPLFNTSLFTKNLETAYTEMYERYQQGLELDHIYVEQSI